MAVCALRMALMRKKGLVAAQFFVDEKVDIALRGGIGEGSFHFLRDSLVQLYSLPEHVKVKETIARAKGALFLLAKIVFPLISYTHCQRGF